MLPSYHHLQSWWYEEVHLQKGELKPKMSMSNTTLTLSLNLGFRQKSMHEYSFECSKSATYARKIFFMYLACICLNHNHNLLKMKNATLIDHQLTISMCTEEYKDTFLQHLTSNVGTAETWVLSDNNKKETVQNLTLPNYSKHCNKKQMLFSYRTIKQIHIKSRTKVQRFETFCGTY